MALYNGFNGDFEIGANAVAELESWQLNGNVQLFTANPKGQAVEQGAAGTQTWKAEVSAFLDASDTNGQVALAVGATVSTLKFYLDGTATDDYYYAVSNAVVESVTYEDPNDYSKFSASLHLQDVPTLTQVA